MRKFSHFGVPTSDLHPGESYVADMKLFLTDYSLSPNKIEFLRFESDSTMPDLLKSHAHIAYQVDDLVSEMQGCQVVLPITKLSDQLTIAFIQEEGIAIELIERTV